MRSRNLKISDIPQLENSLSSKSNTDHLHDERYSRLGHSHEYSPLEHTHEGISLSTSNTAQFKRIYFAANSATDTVAKLAYDNDFTYNPSTKTLTVNQVNGAANKLDINGTTYSLRTGSSGSEGYITFVI